MRQPDKQSPSDDGTDRRDITGGCGLNTGGCGLNRPSGFAQASRRPLACQSLPSFVDVLPSITQVRLQAVPVVSDHVPIHHRRMSAGGSSR